MTHQRAAAGAEAGGRSTVAAVPVMAVRFAGALLALAVAAVHVADQGGVTTLASPGWLGWGFRLIEAAGVLTALALLLPWSAWLGWAAAVLLGLGPLTGYITTRSVGLPGDQSDVGNWGYWVGTESLIIEAALIVLSIAMLLAYRQRPSARPRGGPRRSG
jgi:hypothetical protein